MARKVCKAGVIGTYSFVIVDTDSGVVSQIRDDASKVEATHTDMSVAEKWTDRQLQQLIGKRYEID